MDNQEWDEEPSFGKFNARNYFDDCYASSNVCEFEGRYAIASSDVHQRAACSDVHQRAASIDVHERAASSDVHERAASRDINKYDASSDDDKSKNIILYHYTSEIGANGIRKDRKIKASTGKNNAVYGEGVYLTSLNPYTNSKEKIIRNNYNVSSFPPKNTRLHDKADIAIKVIIPTSEVDKVKDTERDVYLYNGNLNLEEYEHSVIENVMIAQTYRPLHLRCLLSHFRPRDATLVC